MHSTTYGSKVAENASNAGILHRPSEKTHPSSYYLLTADEHPYDHVTIPTNFSTSSSLAPIMRVYKGIRMLHHHHAWTDRVRIEGR